MGRRWLPTVLAAWLLGTTAGAAGEATPLQADKIVIIKHQRRLVLQRDGVALREYRVALGRNPVGHKIAEGDGRTPEGLYHIDARNAASRYHRSLRISYPNAADMQESYARHFEPGGDVRIHGLPAAGRQFGRRHAEVDWTEGCIAVSSEEMEEIWQAVPMGTPVEILP